MSKEPVYINKSKLKDKYAITPNALIQNSAITLEARGLLVYLLSLPSDWKLNIKDLSKKNNVGENKIRKLIKELTKYRYIIRTQSRIKDGTFKSFDYFIYDTPQTLEIRPVDDLPQVDIPQVDNPLVDIGETYKVNNIQSKHNTKETYTDAFEEFWKKYPLKSDDKKWGDKKTTFNIFKKIKDIKQVMIGLSQYSETDEVKRGIRYHPKRFLKDEHYLEYKEETQPSLNDLMKSWLWKYKHKKQLDDYKIEKLKQHGLI